MKVGVPTEIKTDEYRVALTPAGVRELVEHGHEVLIQAGAGEGSAISDDEYTSQGAAIVPDAAAVFAQADMVVKVKEPQAVEVAMLEPRHTLFTYLHLAPDPELTHGLMDSGATCVAYETVEDSRGRLPLLAPMSEVAGKIATQAGAFMLEKPLGGRGILLGGVPGVAAGEGDDHRRRRGRDERGVASRSGWRRRSTSTTATSTACASSTSPSAGVRTRVTRRRWTSSSGCPEVDLVIGAVLVHGAKAPYVIRREQLALMKRQAVLVDVSIDQGGCFETSRPTTHSDPTYEVDGILHYCVANMPGAVPVTSTRALTNATMPYVLHARRQGRARRLAGETPAWPRASTSSPARSPTSPSRRPRASPTPTCSRRWSRRCTTRSSSAGATTASWRPRISRGRARPCSCSSARTTSAARPSPSGRGQGVDARLSRYSYLVSLLPRSVREELGLTIELRPALDLLVLAAAGRLGLLVRTGEPPHRELGRVRRDDRARGRGRLPDADRSRCSRARRCARGSATTRPGRRWSSGRWARCSTATSRTTSSAGSSPPTR